MSHSFLPWCRPAKTADTVLLPPGGGLTQTTQKLELWPCEHIQEKLAFKAEIILTPGPYEPRQQRSGLAASPCFVCLQTTDLEEEITSPLPLGLP